MNSLFEIREEQRSKYVGATLATLITRAEYGGHKGKRALRRIELGLYAFQSVLRTWDSWKDVFGFQMYTWSSARSSTSVLRYKRQKRRR